MTPQEKAEKLVLGELTELSSDEDKDQHIENQIEILARFFELLDAAERMPSSYGERHSNRLGEKLDKAIDAVKAALPEELI